MLLLLSSCSWGPFTEGCNLDEDAVQALAVKRGVTEVWQRMDVICEPRADVELDCRNPTAEACTAWRGSAVARGRVYLSSEATEGLLPLLEHEMTHWDGPRFGDACEAHPPSCDGLP